MNWNLPRSNSPLASNHLPSSAHIPARIVKAQTETFGRQRHLADRDIWYLDKAETFGILLSRCQMSLSAPEVRRHVVMVCSEGREEEASINR